MSTTFTSTVLPIQRAMAQATPLSWTDGIVVAVESDAVVVAFLDDTVATLQLVGPEVGLAAGDPVAYHGVAEVLSNGRVATTARR
ncbi:nuclease [Microbacterium sp. X-17]|uniref:nuclease n=1 Tax=Microbacterium sp. X-17 TaxID=3144404 RepID=UPI0031F4D7C0